MMLGVAVHDYLVGLDAAVGGENDRAVARATAGLYALGEINFAVHGDPFLIPVSGPVSPCPILLKTNKLVRKGGFEPPRLSAPPPQDGVSASSTTSARM